MNMDQRSGTYQPTFWRGKKVLVTGHTGFKGSWLTLWLQHLGAEVIGYSLSPPTEPSMFELINGRRYITSLYGDIHDISHLELVMDEYEPEIIFHLAAQALVKTSYKHPLTTISTNVLGTAHILEIVRFYPKVRCAIIVTTDKVYDTQHHSRPFSETDTLGGLDLYSAGKSAAELLTTAYRHSFFAGVRHPAITTVRAGNVIGGGDWSEYRLLPDIVRSVLHNTPLIVRYPDAIRPWQHVLEPLSGYLRVAQYLFERGVHSEADYSWNFGPPYHETLTVRELIQNIQELWQPIVVDFQQTADDYESEWLKLDASKAQSTLGWAPRLPIQQALQWTIEWYRQFQHGNDLRALSLQQIEEYEQR